VEYFDYDLETPAESFDVEEFLRRSEENAEQRLEEELERIEKQLDDRQQLFEDAKDELESKIELYLERLETAYRTRGSPEELKQLIDEVYQELRREKLKHWRDKQELETERREILREINELEHSDVEHLL
jgi:trichohyalin